MHAYPEFSVHHLSVRLQFRESAVESVHDLILVMTGDVSILIQQFVLGPKFRNLSWRQYVCLNMLASYYYTNRPTVCTVKLTIQF